MSSAAAAALEEEEEDDFDLMAWNSDYENSLPFSVEDLGEVSAATASAQGTVC